MQDWVRWRTKINDYLILTSMFSSLNEFLNHQQNPETPKSAEEEDGEEKPLNFDVMKNFKIEPSLARFIYYYGLTRDSPELKPDTYMFYGIPRARLSESSDARAPTGEAKPLDQGQLRTGMSVREKVRVFESRSNSAWSGRKPESTKERTKNDACESLEQISEFWYFS